MSESAPVIHEIAASASGLNTVTLLAALTFLVAVLWLFLIWPIRIADDIGRRKGRTGWIYPLVGFFLGGGGLGAWLGVLLVKVLPPVPGFFPSTEPLYLPPPAEAVFREEPVKPQRREPYVPPKRCPACKGLVPPESPVCGHCRHQFDHTLYPPGTWGGKV